MYIERIHRIVPGVEARLVEAHMRVTYGTLDNLSPDQFDAEARIAADVVNADPELAEDVARSFGL